MGERIKVKKFQEGGGGNIFLGGHNTYIPLLFTLLHNWIITSLFIERS